MNEVVLYEPKSGFIPLQNRIGLHAAKRLYSRSTARIRRRRHIQWGHPREIDAVVLAVGTRPATRWNGAGTVAQMSGIALAVKEQLRPLQRREKLRRIVRKGHCVAKRCHGRRMPVVPVL